MFCFNLFSLVACVSFSLCLKEELKPFTFLSCGLWHLFFSSLIYDFIGFKKAFFM